MSRSIAPLFAQPSFPDGTSERSVFRFEPFAWLCYTLLMQAREDTGAHARSADVELRGVSKSFRAPSGRVRAVCGIDVSIVAGETVALLGPNGAGKSTTIDMLLGLSRPDSGSVSLLGRAPGEAVDAGLVGAMLQAGALIRDVSVRELVRMMASLYSESLEVGEVLELVGLTEIAGRRTQKLSGGEAQRVRFALALVSDPAVLVLDEPTVGLDVEARRAFWVSVRALAARGKTVIFATHYLEEADAYADRVVLMAHGRVVADGPTSEIRARVRRRTIRATLPEGDPAGLSSLPGVARVERRGEAVSLICSDSDVAIRALLEAHPEVRDIEIVGAGLEDAFVQLTGDENEDTASPEPVAALR
jgi:ABC-2 type transport system ATP-binding protein